MAGFRVAPAAEAELDSIWLYVARESGSIEIASRVVDSITERFSLLARYPQMVADATIYVPEFALSLQANTSSFIALEDTPDESVFILHVMRGTRDIEMLLD